MLNFHLYGPNIGVAFFVGEAVFDGQGVNGRCGM